MRYKFGVMSSVYTLEAEKDIDAKLCMCLFLKTSAPIVIYSPKEKKGAFDPTKYMQEMIRLKYKPNGLKKIMESIK